MTTTHLTTMPMRRLGRTGVDVSLVGLGGAHYEKFKTTQRFDGTSQHPHWLTRAEL